MADITTFPCKYLVFSTGYEERILDALEHGQEIGIPAGITALGYMNEFSHQVIPFITVDETLKINTEQTEKSEEEVYLLIELLHRIRDNNLAKTGVALQIGTFDKVMDTISAFKDMDYCAMYGLPTIKFLKNEEGVIDLAFVTMDAESG